MRKVFLFCFLIIVCSGALIAQDTPQTSPRYENITETGFLAGPMANNRPAPFTISNISSFSINNIIHIGAGVGIEFLEESYLPVFLDLRYYFRDEKFSPFVNFQTGYNLALTNNSNIYPWYSYPEYSALSSFVPYPYPYYGEYNPKGGFFINPQVGFKNMFNEHLGFVFAVGYRYQQLKYTVEDADNNMLIEYNRLTIKLGFIFN